MAWNERDTSGMYFVCFRFDGKRFKRSLKTNEKRQADNLVGCLEENLRLLERGRLELPPDSDLVAFLLSDGRPSGTVAIPEQSKLKSLFDAYFKASPKVVWRRQLSTG
jgi:hypothetical protein